MSLEGRVHFAVCCAIAAALASCGDSKSDGTAASREHLRTDSVGGVLDLGSAPYNAVPGADAYPALQAAVNDSCAQTPWIPSVRIPTGTFPLSQTVTITCGTELFGASRHGTVLHPTFNGPALLLESSILTIATGPALMGSGVSFVETRPPASTVNLSDVPTVALNGLSAFTAETTFSVNSYQDTEGYASIVTSQGVLGTQGSLLGQGLAFGLGIANETQLMAYITVNGTLHAVVSPASIPLGTVHHGAVTFDGATTRLFLDGQVVATAATPGTLTQRAYEDVTIGGTGEGIEGGAYEYPIDGSVDSVRLSNVVRYADPFVPPSDKLQPDASSLVLENFDGQQPGLVRAWGGTTPYWIPIRGSGFLVGGGLRNFTIDGGTGVVGFGVWDAAIHNIDCLNCDYGFLMSGPGIAFDDLLVTAGTSRGRYGILSSSGYGGTELNDVELDGQQFPLIVAGGNARDVVNRVTVNPGENTVFGMIMDRNDPSINGVTIGAGGDAYQAGLLLVGAGPRPLVMSSNIAGNAGRIRRGGPPAAVSSVSQTARSVPPVLVDNWGSGYPQSVTPIIQNTSFVNTQGDPEIEEVDVSASAGSIFSGISVDSNAPVSNDPNALTLPPTSGLPTTVFPAMDSASPIADGSIGPGVFDVNAYGAAPNTSLSTPNVDSYPGIQAAVNAACARGGGKLVLSSGGYSLSRPVLVNCNLEIDGPSMRWSRLVSGGGPALVLNPPGMTGVDEGPPLVGSGHSMKTDGSSYWINLRDYNTDLDGKGASTDTASFTGFSAEAFVKMTSTSPGYAGIVQSAGCLGSPGGTLPGCTSAFQLGTTDGKLFGSMTLGGTSYPLQGPGLPLNTVHHVALTYDGVQTLRLFLDGHVVVTQTVSLMNATIGQQPSEDVTVGPATGGFDGAARSVAIPGYIDSVRISRAAEYSGDFAMPTAKLVPDGNTLAILNFDDNTGGCTLGTYYYPVLRTAEPDGTPEGKVSVTLNNFGFNYRGLFAVNAENSKYLNLYSEGDGFTLTGNSSGSVLDNISMVYGRILAVNSSGSVFHNIAGSYSTTSFVLYGGGDIQVNSLVTSPAAASQYGAYFIQTGVTINGLSIADGNAGSSWKGPVVVDQPSAPFRLYKGEMGGTVQANAGITVGGGLGYLIEGAFFGASNLDAEIIHLSAPTAPGALHQAIGIHYAPGSTVSDDPAIQLIGSGSN